MPPVADGSLPSLEWPYLQALQRLALALALGLFVGLERQRHGKEAGLRTFAFATLLGCLGGLLGSEFALLSVGLVGVLVILLNIHAIVSDHPVELTTSAAMLVMGFVGVLCGHGHTFVPAAVAVLSAALLAWKQPLAGIQPRLDAGRAALGDLAGNSGLRDLRRFRKEQSIPGAFLMCAAPG
jgi:hypothetical protein